MSALTPGLLFIVNSLDVGGAEKQVVALLNRLDSSRFRLHLAYLKRGETLLPQLHRSRLDEVVCCDVGRGISRRAIWQLRELVRTRNIDAIVCTNMYSMLYGALAASEAETRPKLVTAFHSTLLRTYKEKLQMLLYRQLIRRCDLLIYVSDNQRRHWRNMGLRPLTDTVVHNGVDLDYFREGHSADIASATRSTLGFGEKDFIVGLCSALRPEKAPVDLLKAVARLRSQGVPAKALFIGDGSERPVLERKIDELRLTDHARITGIQQDVRPFVSCCDVMTLVSSTETFSIAALESMALAKPLVMTDVGGASEQVVHGQTGLLFEPGDIDALTQHLSTLTSAALCAQMGAAAAQRVQKRYTLEAMTEGFTEEITRLLGSGDLQRPAWLSHYGHGRVQGGRGTT
jgi:glycosyltransferase involved in cell wall biosynthesis